MIRLTYVSQARHPFSDKELEDLLAVSRANNAACSITGILFYGNNMFMQVLEGPKQAVEKTFSKIKHDPRHFGIRVLEKTPVETRRFPDFSMAFKKLSAPEFTSMLGEQPAAKRVIQNQQAVIDALSHQLSQEWEKQRQHVELPLEHEDPLIRVLHRLIRTAVQILAVLMTLVIFWGIADVVWVLYQELITPPVFLLELSDIFAAFGAFLAVLIAIEIFINITLYLRSDVIPVKLVVATALMAIARKVIVLDYKTLAWPYVVATGVVVLALGITYWLVLKVEGKTEGMEE